VSRLSALALSQRSVTLLLAVALFIGGISAWGSLKQELLPDIDFPVITIVAPFPGAGATDVAEQVSKPIEQSIQSVPRLASLRSTSANSIALIVAQFSFGTDVKATQATIEQNIGNLGLPDAVDPQISALNINSSPVVIASIAATSGTDLATVAQLVDDEIVPHIASLEGVAAADITGSTEPQLTITLDPQKLADSGVSVAQISGVLQANNITVPSGQLQADGTRIPVSTIGQLTTVDQISNLLVGAKQPATVPDASPLPGQFPTPVKLSDVGTVQLENIATTGYARTNGNPSLTLTVTKTSDGNTVQTAQAVEKALNDAAAAHPDQITVTVVQNLSNFIVESQDGLLREGGLGALFAIVTIFLFLFSVRSTLVAAISIPLSVLSALVLMQVAGITLNVLTLGGLAVAVGRVVDDAIVVLENIYRHRAMGEDRMSAVLNGPREVARAITASTLTTILVFLPIGFVGGLVSQLFLPFAITVTFALAASLICALTVVPVLAYLFVDRVKLNVDKDGEPKNSFWIRVYVPSIRVALRSRWTRYAVLATALVLFIASLTLVGRLPTQFINTGSEKVLGVTLAPPAGASSQSVLDEATKAEGILIAQPEVEIVQTSVPGESDTGFRTILSALNGQPANSASMTLRLAETADLDEQSVALSDALQPVKDDGYDVAVAQTAGFTNNGLNIVVSGSDAASVEAATNTVMTAISGRSDLSNLKTDLVKATPEIQVTVDPSKAALLGSTAAQIAQQVRAILSPTTVGTVTLQDDGPADLVLRTDSSAITSVDVLGQLPVGAMRTAPLNTVAEVKQADVQGSITRIDGQPAAQITAEIASADTGKVSTEIKQQVDDLTASGSLPAGVDVTLAGVTQQQNEAFGGLFTSMGVAVLLVYVMMVLAFNSLITPFIILFSLPLATIGAFTALFVTGRPIGVSALIGFLMLIGIVVTNAIVLLDLVERLRGQGVPLKDAIIEGGRTRVRPILMTAFATILALIPLAAGFNQGSIIAAELGTVVIGGLFSSTLLTLIVVPVLYYMVESTKDSIRRRLDRAPQAAPPTPIAEPEPAV
jgi:hydrophobic/amphiphilic exporter-1 (mainly G- bacteria), HAE1 family